MNVLDLSELTLEGTNERKMGRSTTFILIARFQFSQATVMMPTSLRLIEQRKYTITLSWLFGHLMSMKRVCVVWSRLDLKKGGKVLITSVGAGNDLPT